MRLSILVCSIPERLGMFNTISDLSKQCNDESGVELLYLGDNKTMSIGEKRNKLIKLASGEYIVFVDDDDAVVDDFVECILAAISSKPDIVTFNAEYFENGKKGGDVFYNMKYRKDENKPGLYLRLPNHLCPVRRDIASHVSYKDLSFGEDSDYATRLKRVIKTQVRIEKSLYKYFYNEITSRSRR